MLSQLIGLLLVLGLLSGCEANWVNCKEMRANGTAGVKALKDCPKDGKT